ncbi:MAG: AAA family ATPase [Bacteroidetes bacterium]|nr:MAG: AAA family ATPase [Bacteroidota bacterium]
MFIKREIEKELLSLMEDYPVVTITGPRQSGKTTLAKTTFPGYNYCNLENPEIRQLAENDPNAFFASFSQPLIIDEIQRVPQLLSFIQVIVDEKNKKGLFLLTGSHQQSLREAVSQYLAGRTALLRLLPFSIKELLSANIELNRDKLIYTGFLPGIYDNKLNPTKAYRNYFQTYVERDLRQLLQVKNLSNFENFIRLLAGRVGQILNLHALSGDLGVSATTLTHWLSVLEASFLVFRLQPYFENFGKRLVKSPKLYFTDVGLVCYLLGIETPEQVTRDPLIGGLFENMVVMEAVKTRLNKGLDPNLFYFRDNNKNEVDLIYKKQRMLTPIEIKSAMTFNEKLLKGIAYFQRTSNQAQKGYLVYSGDLTFERDNVHVINFKDVYKILE